MIYHFGPKLCYCLVLDSSFCHKVDLKLDEEGGVRGKRSSLTYGRRIWCVYVTLILILLSFELLSTRPCIIQVKPRSARFNHLLTNAS